MVPARAPRVRANVSPSVLDYLARLQNRAALRAPATDGAQLQRFLRRMERTTPPAEPLADMLNRNERTRTLLESRVDRLTPEQQQGSLASIWVQAQREAAEAAAAQRAADARRARDMRTGATVAGLGALGAGAFSGRMQQEQEAQRLARELGTDMAVDNAVAEIEIDPPVDFMPPDSAVGLAIPDLFADDTYLDVGDTADAATVMEMVDDSVAAIPMLMPEVEPPLDANQAEEMADLESLHNVTTGQAMQTYLNKLRRMGRRSPEEELFASLPGPDEAVSLSPGPETEVAPPDDLETLPGPQLRSIKALMRGGIPEGRARDIILRGSSMSPDEYRMVTGGRM
jgi:hypothetical protein